MASPPPRGRHRLGLAAAFLVAASLLSASAARRDPETVRPELFGAGLFSTGAWDFFVAWAPDGRSALFCRADDEFSTFQIFETRRMRDGRWSAPRVPAFAREWSNADPHITRDGRRVYFISNRPVPGDTATTPRPTYDIWYADRGPGGEWGEARHLDAPANTPATEWSPSLSSSGNLYFGAARRGGKGQNDLWVSRLVDGAYQPPENLGDSINTAGSEIEPWIAPDESYLVFSGAARADSVGGYDLYASVRRNGVWQRARLLPEGVNTPALEFNQSVSPDGRWLYFSSTRRDPGPLGPRFDWPRHPANVAGIGSGTGDVYRVPMSALGLRSAHRR